jgi:hypothetical protein
MLVFYACRINFALLLQAFTFFWWRREKNPLS